MKSTPQPPAEATVPAVLALLTEWGADPYDEALSQIDHALQSAALAADAGADDSLVAAALLHDVGHLLDMAAGQKAQDMMKVDLEHEASGARWLATLFPPEVTAPIALHVRAKRYLCAVEPSYEAELTEGSRQSLIRQGGPMSPDEVASFESNAGSADAVLLRRWDDAGKVDGLPVPPLTHYEPLLNSLALGNS